MKLMEFARIIERAPRARRSLAIAITTAIALTLGACGPDTDETAPLAYAPAETPYVFANIEPVSSDVIDAWTRLLEPVQKGYAESLKRAREKLAKSGNDEESRKIISVMELFEDKLSVEGWEKVGFSRTGRFALYGVGMLPVMRVELGNPDALRGFIVEIQTRIGETFPVAEIDGQSYWRFVPPNEKNKEFALVAAIIGNHFVLTLDPGQDVAPLADLLGLNAPAKNLLDSGELLTINKQYGYGPHGTALVDSRRLVAALLGTEGQQTWFARKMAEDGTPVTPACRTELAGMADNLPRFVSGYTNLDGSRMDSAGLLELKPSIAQALVPVAAPVPGLGDGVRQDAEVEFGFGMKLDKLAEFIQAQASVIRAQPYACEWFTQLNEGAEEVGQQMAGLYMAAGWFTGMRAVMTEFTLGDDGTPEKLEGGLVIASPNPAGLIGMLKSFVPQLGQVELVAGAEPVAISLEEMGAGVGGEGQPPTFAALTQSAIGIGVGANGASELKTYLAASSPTPPPLLHIGYSGSFYARFMEDVQKKIAQRSGLDEIDAEMDGLDGDAESDAADIDLEIAEAEAAIESGSADDHVADTESEVAQQILEPMMISINQMYNVIDYTAVDLVITERGLEMKQVMQLK